MLAEDERAQIRERSLRGKAHRARGVSRAVMSGAPYGCRYVRKFPAMWTPSRRSTRARRRSCVRSSTATPSVASRSRTSSERCRRRPSDTHRQAGAGSLDGVGDAAQPRPPRTGSVRQDADHRPAREAQPPGRDRGERHGRRETRRDVAPEQWTRSRSPRYRRGDLRARPGAPTGEQALRQAQQQRARAAEGILVCRDCGYACWRTSARTTKRRLYSYRCIGSDNCRHVACVDPADPRRRTRCGRVGRSRAAPVRPTLIRAEIERRPRPLRTESPATHRRAGLERELVRVKNVGEPCAGEPHARIDGDRRKPAPVGASPRGARRLSPTRPTPSSASPGGPALSMPWCRSGIAVERGAATCVLPLREGQPGCAISFTVGARKPQVKAGPDMTWLSQMV